MESGEKATMGRWSAFTHSYQRHVGEQDACTGLGFGYQEPGGCEENGEELHGAESCTLQQGTHERDRWDPPQLDVSVARFFIATTLIGRFGRLVLYEVALVATRLFVNRNATSPLRGLKVPCRRATKQ